MNQYYSELLINSITAIAFIIVIFCILYFIYLYKKKNYTDFKNFLESSRIYIEIFLIICLSFMSIIIATNANIIAENDLIIQKTNNQPLFVFDELRYGDGYYEKLLVYNSGAPLNSFHIAPFTFLKVHGYENDKLKEITIPIEYYVISTRSGNDSSKLQEFFASDTEQLNGNYYRLSSSIGDFNDISRNNNFIGGIIFYKYVYITYKDIYGEEHNDLYVISDLYPHKVSDEEKNKILRNFDESIKYGPTLNVKDLTAEKVYNIFNNSYWFIFLT